MLKFLYVTDSLFTFMCDLKQIGFNVTLYIIIMQSKKLEEVTLSHKYTPRI